MESLDNVVKEYDAILSMACGVGIQFMAERYPDTPVFPGVDTSGMSVNRRSDGTKSAAVPARAACWGGPAASVRLPCAPRDCTTDPAAAPTMAIARSVTTSPVPGFKIYERLSAQGRLDNILTFRKPRDWKDQYPGP
jgi:hypothetical protein